MYELRVLTGLHRGAALPLIGEQWSIGADENADLVLFDPGIKPHHCRLEWRQDGWALAGIQGKITDAEGHRSDALAALGPNTAFALNGIWLTVVDAATPWPSDDEEEARAEPPTPSPTTSAPSAPKRSALPFFLGFLSAAAIVATSTWATLSPQPTVEPAPVPQVAEGKLVLATADAVERQLRRMLADRELDDRVRVEVQDQRIVLEGALLRQEQELVERMLTRFQQRFSTSLPVDNQISALSRTLPFEIAQITSGPMGSVITQDGQRLFVGDELDGLRLVAIDDHKVVFKGHQDYEVAW
jgi:type III secretion protein D